jgi:hypothetical protein
MFGEGGKKGLKRNPLTPSIDMVDNYLKSVKKKFVHLNGAKYFCAPGEKNPFSLQGDT